MSYAEPLNVDRVPDGLADEWRELTGAVALNESHRALAVEWCRARRVCAVAGADLVERGPLVEGARGNLVANPAQRVWSSAVQTLVALSRALGIEPPDPTAKPPAPEYPGDDASSDELARYFDELDAYEAKWGK